MVDDGSTDDTAEVAKGYAEIRLIRQRNAGPAAARNHGARAARGSIILFTDDDCVPTSRWVEAMLAPFQDSEVVAVKGAYRTRQKELAARFVQIEYEDRYRRMARLPGIDFIDTYSAAYRRSHFLEAEGYDTSFPVACAEDAELSYRMSARGWKMKFAPEAVVYHTHPNTFARYLKKKYKFAFWRMLAVRKNPAKGVKDSHTPQLMKLQLLLIPSLVLALIIDTVRHGAIPSSAVVLGAFLLSVLPFTIRAARKDFAVGFLAPALLALRACAQFTGVIAGLIYTLRQPRQVATNSTV